jgi:hypothetical protein
MPSWRKVILSGSNAALNSLNVTTSITASTVSASSGFTGSLFGTSSWARNTFTASFVTPLTQSVIVSGSITGSNLSINGFPNVSASLASLSSGVGTLQQVTDAGNTTTNAISSSFPGVGFYGTASWAINVVNGGGGGGGGVAYHTQTLANVTWSFAHNLGIERPVITVYDDVNQVIIPEGIDGIDSNNIEIYFPISQSGYATAVGGVGGGGSTNTGSLLTTASVNLNTITFTKGDGSTFPITVNTGSTPTLQQVTTQGASTTVPITASIVSASSFTGSLFGTASWANNAISTSYASTASYVNPLNQEVYLTGKLFHNSGSNSPFNYIVHQTGSSFISGSIRVYNSIISRNELIVGPSSVLFPGAPFPTGSGNTNPQRIYVGRSWDSSSLGLANPNSWLYNSGIITFYSSLSNGFARGWILHQSSSTNSSDDKVRFKIYPTINSSYPSEVWFGNEPSANSDAGNNQIIFGFPTGSTSDAYVIITGSTYITGGFEALGNRGSKIQLGTYNIGYDLTASPTLYITGSGLIISGNMPDQNHHNFLKIGNVELVDVNTALTSNEFLIHNVNTLRITSGADGGDITNSGQLLKIGGGEFYVYRAGSSNVSGIIRSVGSTTTIEDTNVVLTCTNVSLNTNNTTIKIPDINLMSTLDGNSYITSFITNPSTTPETLYKIKADKFIWVTGSNQIISGGLTITGSLNVSQGITSSLFGTASWALNVVGGGGGGVTINNNVDNYLITATGTANTLNGEVGLQYSGSILINASRSQFGGAAVLNTTHQFRGLSSDINAGFLIQDPDGEDLLKTEGSVANSDSIVTIGDVGGAGNSTKVQVIDVDNQILLTGKVLPNSIQIKNLPTSTAGYYDIGSKIANGWGTVSGPALTAGRVVYYSGSGNWDQAQANVSGSSRGLLGVVTELADQREILLEGVITISGSALFSGSIGQAVYLSAATAGQVTLTPATASNNVVRHIGYVTKNNSNQMYFNPDSTYTVII